MSKASLGTRAHGLRLERIKASTRYFDGSFRNTHPASPGLKQGTLAPTVPID